MNIEESEKSLRQFLRSQGLPLKTLSAQDALRIMTEFWLSTSIDGVRPDKGDGLVAYFELMDRGRGTFYEFGINRILRMPPPDGVNFWEWVPGYKLRLSVAFKPSLEVFRLKPVVATFDCWDKERLLQFVEEVEVSAQFQCISNASQGSSNIGFSECVGPQGEPNHATKGLTWATV